MNDKQSTTTIALKQLCLHKGSLTRFIKAGTYEGEYK